MAVYDIRYLASSRQPQPSPQPHNTKPSKPKSRGNATRPIVIFENYQNAAHLKTGLDILLPSDPGGPPGGGIVAAAQDDGTVGLWSLADGGRLAGGEVDKIQAGGVVKCLMWRALAGDTHASLFVGEGNWVGKYSFWA